MLAGIVFLSVYSIQAQAELLSFSMNANGDLREADVQLIEKDGVQYVALSALVNQIGGGYTKTADGIQVDLAEKTAILRSNNAQVSAVSGSFSLSRPITDQNGETLIAVSDVTAFFNQAFNVSLKQDLPTTTAPTTPPPATPPTETPAAPPPAETPPATQPATPPDTPGATGQRTVTRPIQVVVIDAGHGGGDSGLVGASKVK